MKLSHAFSSIHKGLHAAGVESPDQEAELYLRERFGLDRTTLHMNGENEIPLGLSEIEGFISARAKGYPLAYALGKVEFMDFKFGVDPRAMIPRQETELLVEAAVKYCPSFNGAGDNTRQGPIIVDVGTGCGNISISLACLVPHARIYATDISGKAIALARENARVNGLGEERVTFLKGSLFAPLKSMGLDGGVDLLVSNPPYIPSSRIKRLQRELSFEPRAALDGGEDGLNFYRGIISDAPGYLRSKGYLLLELGIDQVSSIQYLTSRNEALSIVEVIRDYSGIDRVACVQRD